MIANSANPYPQGVPHPVTLNDLRVQNTVPDAPSSASALTLAGVALAVVLAVGAFLWLDPLHLHLFTPTAATPPTPAVVPSGDAARPTERQDITAPLAPAPATKSVEAPTAPTPAAQAPQAQAPAVQPRTASVKPESRRNQAKANANTDTDTDTKVAQASTNDSSTNDRTAPLMTKADEMAAPPPVLLSKPQEKADATSAPKITDDTRNVPRPATTNEQAPAPE